MKLVQSIKKRLIFCLITLPRRVKYSFLSTAKHISGKAIFEQPCQLCGEGKISFGKNVHIGYKLSPFLYSGYGYIEARNNQSKILIEDNVRINNNIVIISEGDGVKIGEDTLIGTNCEIYDTDFHNLDIDKRTTGQPATAPIIISRNVFLGSNVKVLKGVTIGENSIIANSSLVTTSIPSDVIAGGVPAKVIKSLNSTD